MTRWVVFSDLDESLLDRNTYSFEAARPALELLRRRSIPLVLCTSKTAAETLHFQRLLGIRTPFVVEAGGGVYVPKGYFERLGRPREDRGARVLLPLAAGREEILRGFRSLQRWTDHAIRGFSDMTVEEVAADTGLSPDQARLAMEREFDEPFKIVRGERHLASLLPAEARRLGLRVSKGGRYYHLHGKTDKGRAVELLQRHFARKLGEIRSLAVGDSEIDLPMLAAVDLPIAVRRRDGKVDPALRTSLERLHPAGARGAAGWNRGVLWALGGRGGVRGGEAP